MKVKVSISMDESTLKDVEEMVNNSIFRNKSHFIEEATYKFLQEARKWKR